MKEIKITPSITSRDTQNLNRYFNDISSSRPLDPEKEVELANRIQQGDLQARNELVTANLRFVISVAKQYQHMGAPLEDLINEGNIGLIRAAERFDPTKGFKFATFAVWWIRQAVLNYFVDNGQPVRFPQNVANLIYRIRTESMLFEQEHLRTPSVEELARILDLPEKRIEDYLSYNNYAVSLDAPLNSDTETTVGETLSDSAFEATDNYLISESLQNDLNVALASIPVREQQVLRMFYGLDGEPLSLDSIALELHLSRERVRQLKEKGLRTVARMHGSALAQYT